MRKLWMIALLAISLSTNLPVCGATNGINVIYNGTNINLGKGPVMRFNKVWLPARALSEQMGYGIRYEKQEKMVYIGGTDKAEIGMVVVKAGSAEDDGDRPVLLNNMVYLSVRDVAEKLKEDVKWESKTKTVYISSCTPLWNAETGDTSDGLKYDRKTGDFYNGKMLIANLPFKCVDSITAEKHKTANNHVLYTVCNSYGEPHINDELYSIYMVNGGYHIAESFKWNANGDNSLIQGNKVVLINKNVISIYNDVNGDLIKRHTISTKPLKDYLAKWEDADELYKEGSKGYLVEGVTDDFVLYRNYMLKTLTLVNLKTDQEVELYKEVYSESELKEVETGLGEDGDYLLFDKVENGKLYLKHAYTGKKYVYVY